MLKNYVILLDWKEELKMGPLLGEGHFASVKLCHRISDPYTSYALKTIKKSTVKKSRKNIVSKILHLFSSLYLFSNRCSMKLKCFAASSTTMWSLCTKYMRQSSISACYARTWKAVNSLIESKARDCTESRMQDQS